MTKLENFNATFDALLREGKMPHEINTALLDIGLTQNEIDAFTKSREQRELTVARLASTNGMTPREFRGSMLYVKYVDDSCKLLLDCRHMSKPVHVASSTFDDEAPEAYCTTCGTFNTVALVALTPKQSSDLSEVSMYGDTLENIRRISSCDFTSAAELNHYAVCILSDAQFVLANGNDAETARQYMNKAKYFICEASSLMRRK